MKILFCDFLCQRGNQHIDSRIINMLSDGHEIFLMEDRDFFRGEIKNKERVKFLGNRYSDNPQGAIAYKIQILRRMWLAASVAKKIEPDLIYVSVYDAIVFPIGLLRFKKNQKIVVVENDNIDLLTNRIHEMTYRMFAHKVHHIVYESFFGEYLINNFQIPKEKIHVIPHLCFGKEKIEDACEIKNYSQADCICISWSNDEDIIRNLIEKEKKEHFFRNNKITCRIKSKKYSFKNEYLCVDNGFLETVLYDKLYDECKCVLIPFPKQYHYRMSGSIIDAASHHKKMITTDFELAKYYYQKYGSIIEVTSDIDDMLEAIKRNCLGNEDLCLDFSKFEIDHSELQVQNCLKEMLENIG